MQDRLFPAPLVKRRRYLLKIARPVDGAGTTLRLRVISTPAFSTELLGQKRWKRATGAARGHPLSVR